MTVNEWLSNLREQLRALPPARRAALGATALGSLAFFLWLAMGLTSPEERLLYRQLDDDEAARVVDALGAEQIPYRLGQGGAVYVPAAQIYEARIRLAGKGLPSGGAAGFEIFDEQGFGVTDFVNRVNYQRALQGELARSIEQLEPVERARVQIAVPERRGFVSARERKSSASVVVRLRAGSELEPWQARGIVHLVASSVEGLDAGRVTLVDARGRLLSPEAESGQPGALPVQALAHQQRLERELAGRVESILERTVGVGRVVARVRADLDWTQTESTAERFDPDSQVARSEELQTETSSDASSLPSGVPGIASNSPDLAGGPAATGSGSSSTRSTETINYEISKVVSHTVEAPGRIVQLDVAVLVDGKPDAEGEGFAAWDAESLQKFEELSKRAVGFSAERGDRITVTNAPFRSIELEDQGGGWLSPPLLLLVTSLLRVAGVLLALVLAGRLVVKPLLERLAPARGTSLPVRADELELQLAGGAPAGALGADASDPLAVLSRARGEEGVKALRVWLSER